MPVPAPPQQIPAELRVQCRKPEHARDPWEEEAERLQELLALPGAGGVESIHPLRRDSHAWGTSIDADTAAQARSHPGHPLDPAIRHDFEARLNRDLGGVRVHDDETARHLVHSLGAEAFTLGNDIFTTRADRALLAHEVVHTVQQRGNEIQATDCRVQAKITRASADLDPKVDELIKGHLERDRDPRVDAELDKVATEIRNAKSWWAEFRADLEPSVAGGAVRVGDVKKRTEKACEKIHLEYKARDAALAKAPDPKGGDPIQNALAGLLTDYLRRNGEIDAATLVVQKFAYVRTYLPSEEVLSAIGTTENWKKLGGIALSQLPFVHPSLKSVWPGSIQAALTQFLRLPPLPEFDKARSKIAADLQVDPPVPKYAHFPKGADLFSASIDISATPDFNELAGLSFIAVFGLRKRISEELADEAANITATNAGEKLSSPVFYWQRMIRAFDAWRAEISQSDLSLERALSKAMEQPIAEEVAFWNVVRDLADWDSNDFKARVMERLAQSGWPLTEAMLREHPKLLEFVDKLGPKLAAAAETYFALRKPDELKSIDRRRLSWVLELHPEKARAFAEFMIQEVEPPILKALRDARKAAPAPSQPGKEPPTNAEAFGWLAARLNLVTSSLQEAANLGNSQPDLVQQFLKRRAVALVLSDFAFEASGKAAAERRAEQAAQAAPAAGGTTPTSSEPSIFEQREKAAAWGKIYDRAQDALYQRDIKTSVLFFPAEVKEASDHSLLQLDADFGQIALDAPIIGSEPFTPRDILHLLHRKYYSNLLEAIGPEMVEARKKGAGRDQDDLWISGRAIEKAEKAAGGPRRYYVPGASVFWYENDTHDALLQLLWYQPLFQKWWQPKRTRNAYITNVGWTADQGDLWLWTYPKPHELVGALYSIPTLRGLVHLLRTGKLDSFNHYTFTDAEGTKTERYAATATSLRIAAELGKEITDALPTAEAYDWYEDLTKLVNRDQILGGGSKEQRAEDPEPFKKVQGEVAAVGKKRAAEVKLSTDKMRIKAHEALRKATTLDRAVVLPLVAEQMAAYDRNDIGTEHILGTALENIDVFRRSVQPRTERERSLQTAALMVELASKFREIYGEQSVLIFLKAADLPIGFNQTMAYEFIQEALANLDKLLVPKGKGPDPELIETETHAEGVLLDEQTSPKELKPRIDAARVLLQEALEPMRQSLFHFQWQFGITGSAASQTLTSHIKGSKLKAAAAKGQKAEETKAPEFVLDGIGIKIIRVHEDFVYLPGPGDRISAQSTAGPYAMYLPARLYLGKNLMDEDTWEDSSTRESILPAAVENPRAHPANKGSPKIPLTNPSAPEVKLVRLQLFAGSNPLTEEFDLTSYHIGGSSPGMVWLAHVVHRQTIINQLNQLASLIEGFGEALMFVVSLHPVGRAAVLAVEAIRLVDSLLNDPDFLGEIDALRRDPAAILGKISDVFAEKFTLDGVFDFLLNGNFNAPDFAHRTTPKGRRSSSLSMKGKAGKGQRLITRIRRLGAVTAMRLESFQDKVQRPVHSIEANLARHPTFAALVSWLGKNAALVLEGRTGLERLLLQHPIGGPILEQYLIREERKKMSLPAAPSTSILEGFGDAAGGFSRPLEEALENAASFELPYEVLPLPMAIDALIDTLIRIAQKPKNLKVKAAALVIKALKEGADSFGITSYATTYLADQIRNTPLDPNTYWRDQLLPRLRDPIQGTIHSAADQVGGMLKAMPVIGPLMKEKGVAPPDASGIKAEVTPNPDLDQLFESDETEKYIAGLQLPDTEEAETVSYAALRTLPDIAIQNIKPTTPGTPPQQTPPESQGSPHLMPSQGDVATIRSMSSAVTRNADNRPLPPAVRSSVEQRFGHDFSHVRLSQGPGALQATVGQGADAVTTGSHIHLRPDLNPAAGQGARILDHELAHVLQKTGGTPSAGAAPQTSRGLRLCHSEESAADRMANRARHGSPGAIVPIEGAHRDGASPSISADLLKTFLLKVADPAAAAKLVAAAERAHAPDRTGPDALDKKVEEEAGKIWKNLFGAIKAGTMKGSHAYLKTDATLRLIAGHLKKRVETVSDLSAASHIVAFLAANRQVSKRGKPKEKSLQVAGFLDDLELYLTGRSGVVLSFPNKLRIVSNTATVPELEVAHLELHLVRATDESKEIWDTAIKNSWPTEFGAAAPATSSPDKILKFRNAVGDLLEQDFGAPIPATATAGAPPPPGTTPAAKKEEPSSKLAVSYTTAWQTSATDLKFDDAFRARVEARLQPPTLETKLIPPWQIYVGKGRKSEGLASLAEAEKDLAGVKEIAAGDRHRAASIGLHLGTHGDFTKDHAGDFLLDPNARNSHHIAQYLLPEYFGNEKGFQPFPHPAAYPGVEPSGGGPVTRIKHLRGSEQPIEVALTGGTKSGRGEKMPAINLSASTHLGSDANLHVTPTADDMGQASQGYSIHIAFQQRLQAKTGKKSAVEADAYLRANPKDPKANEALFDAMRETYAWIWKDSMRDGLIKRMPEVEARYYLSQFPSTDPARFERLQKLHDNKVPEASDIAAAIRARALQAETHMIEGLRNLGWKLPS